MELKIYNPQEDGFLQQIDWNFEELKQEITAKVENYKNLVYSDDQMKEAKKDRANLRKFITALEGKRKELKKQIMIPYDSFEKQEKELVLIVNQAVENIDIQVKGYEEGLRAEKTKKVQEIYKEIIGDMDRILPFEKLFKQEYSNATVTLKSIREEMSETIKRVDTELKLINAENGRFVFEMKEAYLKNLDMHEALKVKQDLEETQRRKEEFESMSRQIEEEENAKRQEEARKVMEAGRDIVDTYDTITDQNRVAEKKEKVLSITFKVTANESQFSEVNRILYELQNASMKFEIVSKEEK